MSKKITIEPVTRVEGHGKVTIHLNKKGAVENAFFHIVLWSDFLENLSKISLSVLDIAFYFLHAEAFAFRDFFIALPLQVKPADADALTLTARQLSNFGETRPESSWCFPASKAIEAAGVRRS